MDYANGFWRGKIQFHLSLQQRMCTVVKRLAADGHLAVGDREPDEIELYVGLTRSFQKGNGVIW